MKITQPEAKKTFCQFGLYGGQYPGERHAAALATMATGIAAANNNNTRTPLRLSIQKNSRTPDRESLTTVMNEFRCRLPVRRAAGRRARARFRLATRGSAVPRVRRQQPGWPAVAAGTSGGYVIYDRRNRYHEKQQE